MPTLSSNYAWSPTTRPMAFKKHPVFRDEELACFVSDEPSGFLAGLYAASPGAYKLAKCVNKDIACDDGAEAMRVTIRALVAVIAMFTDCARSSLASSRPRAADTNF